MPVYINKFKYSDGYCNIFMVETSFWVSSHLTYEVYMEHLHVKSWKYLACSKNLMSWENIAEYCNNYVIQ